MSFRSIIAALLTLTFTLGQIVPAAAVTPSPIPQEVILIEDAHSDEATQLAIEKLLREVTTTEKIDVVAIEGAWTRLTPEVLAFNANPKTNRAILLNLLKHGEISGADLFSASQKSGLVFEGIETKSLYTKYFHILQQILRRHDEAESFSTTLRERLRDQASRELNPALRDLIRQESIFDAGHLKLPAYLDVLKKVYRQEFGQDLTALRNQLDYPQILHILALEKKASAPGAEREYNTFKKSLPSKLRAVLVRSLLETFSEKQKPFHASENLKAALRFHLLEEELSGTKLFEEIDVLTGTLLQKLARTEHERALLNEWQNAKLFSKLLKVELSREDWTSIKDKSFPYQEMRSLYQLARQFYTGAELRDEAMFKNLIAQIAKHHAHKTILVTGGFHTSTIAKLLTRHGIATRVVTPERTAQEAEGYSQLADTFSSAQYRDSILHTSVILPKLSTMPKPDAAQPRQELMEIDPRGVAAIHQLVGEFKAASLGMTEKEARGIVEKLLTETGCQINDDSFDYFVQLLHRGDSDPEELRGKFIERAKANKASLQKKNGPVKDRWNRTTGLSLGSEAETQTAEITGDDLGNLPFFFISPYNKEAERKVYAQNHFFDDQLEQMARQLADLNVPATELEGMYKLLMRDTDTLHLGIFLKDGRVIPFLGMAKLTKDGEQIVKFHRERRKEFTLEGVRVLGVQSKANKIRGGIFGKSLGEKKSVFMSALSLTWKEWYHNPGFKYSGRLARNINLHFLRLNAVDSKIDVNHDRANDQLQIIIHAPLGATDEAICEAVLTYFADKSLQGVSDEDRGKIKDWFSLRADGKSLGEKTLSQQGFTNLFQKNIPYGLGGKSLVKISIHFLPLKKSDVKLGAQTLSDLVSVEFSPEKPVDQLTVAASEEVVLPQVVTAVLSDKRIRREIRTAFLSVIEKQTPALLNRVDPQLIISVKYDKDERARIALARKASGNSLGEQVINERDFLAEHVIGKKSTNPKHPSTARIMDVIKPGVAGLVLRFDPERPDNVAWPNRWDHTADHDMEEALDSGFNTIVLVVGPSGEITPSGKDKSLQEILMSQLKPALINQNPKILPGRFFVAFQPQANSVLSVEDIQSVHRMIRQNIAEIFAMANNVHDFFPHNDDATRSLQKKSAQELAERIPVIYAGNVAPEQMETLMASTDIAGILKQDDHHFWRLSFKTPNKDSAEVVAASMGLSSSIAKDRVFPLAVTGFEAINPGALTRMIKDTKNPKTILVANDVFETQLNFRQIERQFFAFAQEAGRFSSLGEARQQSAVRFVAFDPDASNRNALEATANIVIRARNSNSESERITRSKTIFIDVPKNASSPHTYATVVARFNEALARLAASYELTWEMLPKVIKEKFGLDTDLFQAGWPMDDQHLRWNTPLRISFDQSPEGPFVSIFAAVEATPEMALEAVALKIGTDRKGIEAYLTGNLQNSNVPYHGALKEALDNGTKAQSLGAVVDVAVHYADGLLSPEFVISSPTQARNLIPALETATSTNGNQWLKQEILNALSGKNTLVAKLISALVNDRESHPALNVLTSDQLTEDVAALIALTHQWNHEEETVIALTAPVSRKVNGQLTAVRGVRFIETSKIQEAIESFAQQLNTPEAYRMISVNASPTILDSLAKYSGLNLLEPVTDEVSFKKAPSRERLGALLVERSLAHLLAYHRGDLSAIEKLGLRGTLDVKDNSMRARRYDIRWSAIDEMLKEIVDVWRGIEQMAKSA